ncbi:MAG TPA: hypothetical protein VJ779_21760 [Acetobacteraceae bacterium]|nr:hypothetical protein [Acetobacteraceae bacterium]
MALDLTKLVGDFQNYFLSLYHQDKPPAPAPQAGTAATEAQASCGPILAFEGLGTPITPEMFTLKSGELYPGLVVEQFSLLANVLPALQGSSIAGPGLLTVDGLYGMMLGQAQALAASDLEALGAVKRHAEKAFEQTLPGMTPGTGEFHPAVPTPPDWPLPSGAAAWSSHSFEQSETVTTRPPSPPRPPVPSPPILVPRRPPPPAWAWHVAPPALAGKLHSVEAVQTSLPPRRIAPPPRMGPPPRVGPAPHPVTFHPALAAAMTLRSEQIAALAQPATAPAARPEPGAQPAPAAHPAVMFRSDLMMLRVAELSQNSTPKAVTAKRLKLSFDYCLVRASRPWISTELLTTRNWYLPRTKAGEFASGTGTGGGAFEVMPVAALAVKNLVIEADFSSDETAVLDKLDRFGPFSLVGRTITASRDALQCKGMQIIGWVFEPMPRLPPNSDPALDHQDAPNPVVS